MAHAIYAIHLFRLGYQSVYILIGKLIMAKAVEVAVMDRMTLFAQTCSLAHCIPINGPWLIPSAYFLVFA